MKHTRTLAVAAVAAVAAVVGATPASATLAAHRTATIATVEEVASYPTPSGYTVVYTAAAVERGLAGNVSEIAVTCTAASPAYFLWPSVTDITPTCTLRDDTTGRTYSAPDLTSTVGVPVAAAAGVFTVPTNHTYSLCMSVRLWGMGHDGPTRCARLS